MFWWWLSIGSARAEPAEEAVPEPPAQIDPVSDDFVRVLEAAKQLWFEGRTLEAREWFATLHGRILAGESVELAQVTEALTWLGEVQYQDGDPEGARLTFEALFARNIDATISPYSHPAEVVYLFELVRSEVKDRLSVPPPVVRPPAAPGWVLAPLGIPQLVQGRTGAGLASGGIQLALGTASVGTRVYLARLNNKEQPGILPGSDAELRIQRLRYGVQWPTTFLAYGAWVAGSWEAARSFRIHWQAEPVVLVTLQPGGASVTVGGQF